MLRKVTLALVAAASLSAMALAPSAASAKPWGGGGLGMASPPPLGPWLRLWRRLHRWRLRRLLPDPPRVHPVRREFRTVNVCAY